MFSAAGQTRDRATDPADARQFLVAVRAHVNKSRRKTFRRERQVVATRFVRDSKSATCPSPFRPVRRDSASTDSPLREQMRQLVSKCSVDLVTVIVEQGIQRN